MKLFLALLFVGVTPAKAPSITGLCKPGEQVLLSCQMQASSKQLSLCGIKPEGATKGSLAYRFGTPQKIELAFPAQSENSLSQFTQYTYFRGGGLNNAGMSINAVRFVNNAVTYEVFSNWTAEDDKKSWGVTVTGETETTLNCAEPAVNLLDSFGGPGAWLFEVLAKD